MKRILKNVSRATIETNYNGKIYKIKSKGSIILDHGGNDEHAADYLLQTFGFLKETTPTATVEKLSIRTAVGE